MYVVCYSRGTDFVSTLNFYRLSGISSVKDVKIFAESR